MENTGSRTSCKISVEINLQRTRLLAVGAVQVHLVVVIGVVAAMAFVTVWFQWGGGWH